MQKSETLFSFEGLKVWQEARLLTKLVYQFTLRLPDYEKYALGNQIRRAMISVTSNIAEGSARFSYKEKIHFLEIAYGSLAEVYNQLVVGSDLDYFSFEEIESLKPAFEFVAKLIRGRKYKFAENLNS
ncbi:four helix bundle protein [Prevotellamassilia timonensis]|uniref:four helix bundle protein n=1 Tax=Prevotellamassilia timonensis TaxID=1852370 RepID=UPI003077EBAD